MATITESALQAKTTVASITCNDLNKSLQFYEGLGFAVEERWEEEGKLRGAMLRAGNARLGLDQDDWKKGRDRVKGVGLRLWFATDQDIDNLARRAKNNGVKLTREPYNEWGMHGFDVTDPDGFLISISTEPEKQA
jgi:predicted lactoylglutathione lyase